MLTLWSEFTCPANQHTEITIKNIKSSHTFDSAPHEFLNKRVSTAMFDNHIILLFWLLNKPLALFVLSLYSILSPQWIIGFFILLTNKSENLIIGNQFELIRIQFLSKVMKSLYVICVCLGFFLCSSSVGQDSSALHYCCFGTSVGDKRSREVQSKGSVQLLCYTSA